MLSRGVSMRRKGNNFKVLQKSKYDMPPRWLRHHWVFRASGNDGQDPETLIINKAKVVDRKAKLVTFYMPTGEVRVVRMFRWSDPEDLPNNQLAF